MVAFMDQQRTNILSLITAIIAAPKLADVPGDGADLQRKEIVYAAMLHAETILGMIDRRWPRERVPGKG